jgi:hypothetical protein
MIEHESIRSTETRISLLEAAHLDSVAKVNTLVDGFHTLNTNLAILIASINSAIKTILIGATFSAALVGGLWGYHTFITAQIQNTAANIQQIEHTTRN